MPHSSGGGSHSGGSHGGSSHSSSSSSGGSGYHHVVRNSYFVGSRRYVYYHAGRTYYYYSDMTPGTYRTPIAQILIICVAALFFLGFGVLLSTTAKVQPQRLVYATDFTARVVDNENLISNEAELLTTLQEFADTTGIVPIVATCRNSDWSSYRSLENYAYQLYLSSCDDECHWLLVYSIDPNNPTQNWYWEGMQGDDTDDILRSAVLDKFNKALHEGFNQNKPVGQNFNDAFRMILPTVMNPYIEGSTVLVSVVLILMSVAMVAVLFSQHRQNRNFAHSQPIPLRAEEITCQYCRGKFVPVGEKKCPHCGAVQVDESTDDITF